MTGETAPLDVLISTARQAEAAEDLPTALVVWSTVQVRYPDEPEGYAAAGRLLKRANRLEEAEATVAKARVRFPENLAIAEQFAWTAHEAEKWPEAHSRWTEFRRQFPEALVGYAADGVVLQAMQRFDEAESVYRAAFSRWPTISEFDLLADYAELCQARGHLEEGSRLWAALRIQFPDKPRGYLRDAANLSSAGHHDQAEALLSQALALWPNDPTVLIECAHSAQERGALKDRVKRWEAVLKAFPTRVEGYLGAAHTFFDLQRFADAQNVLRPALQLFPDAASVAELNARIAFARDEFVEAGKRWAAFRERFPAHPAGWAGGVDVFLAVANHGEASYLSDKARDLFPLDLDVAVAWCTVPEQIKDWELAESRWAVACEQFPEALYVKTRYVAALMQNKRWAGAEILLKATLAEHAGDLGLLRTYAECATERGAWAEAAVRWRDVTRRFPTAPGGWNGLGDMLRRAGRLDDSAVLLTSALHKFPDDENLEQSLAWTLTLGRHWPEALRRWEQLTRRFPQRPSVVGGTTFALTQAKQDLELAVSEGRPKPFEIPLSLLTLQELHGMDNADLKRLLMQFESLGDTCEFGMVQRQFGAEPLGLLRWATTTPRHLIAALDNQLKGVGEREFTVIEAHAGEFVTWDKRYSMHSHTFIPETAEPLAAFTERHLRRMQYLRRKLLEDLAAGEKIFVYKCDDGLSVDEAQGLHRALRRYNPHAALLCAMLSDDVHSSGALEWIDDGLFIGFIDRFSTVDVNVNVWVELCRKALEIQYPGRRKRFAS